MANKDDYLTEYRQFFEEFANTVEPNDQLPVKLGSYKFINSEVVGGIVDWCLQYLNRKSCPSTLIGPLIRITIDEIRMACKKHPISCGFNPDENVYEPLKLMQAVMAKVNEVCLRYLDNSQLDTLPTPPTVAPSKVSFFATRNTRRRMEDKHIVIHDINALFNIPDTSLTSYYGIFDGHAGQDAASYSAAHLHQFLVESEFYPTDPERAFKEAFLKTDECFLEKSRIENFRSGTTAVCALLRPKEKTLYVAWVGDSQALLVNCGKILQIVKPHRPSRKDEKDRIEANGGCVMFWGIWRVNGQLAVSRAIGDLKLKPYVTAEPDIVAIPLDGNEDFLIMACDGLWDFVTEDEAGIAVYKCVKKDPDNIDSVAETLSDLAKRKGSRDNISVIVIFLKDPSKIFPKRNSSKKKKLSTDRGWTTKNTTDEAMETGVDNTNINNTASNNAFDLFDVFQKRGNLDPFNTEPEFKSNGTENQNTDLYFLERPSNGKRTADEFDEDDEDFGPETDIDAVDDVVLNPSIALAKALIEGNGNNNESDEKMDTLDVDLELQRQQSSEFEPLREPREETPTPPADSVLDNSGLADNVAESEESEDEWNYYRVDPKQKETSEPPLETSNKVSSGQESQEDDMSQLNPDAKEFIPVSPTRAASSPSPYNRDLVDDTLIAQSPRRAVPMDINVPSPVEFQFEVKQRPSDMFDEFDDDKKTQNQNGHQLTSQEIMENLLNGKDVSEIEFHPQNYLKTESDNYLGNNLICENQKENETETSKEIVTPSEEHQTESSLSPMRDESDFSTFVPKTQDPMSMSFYQDKNEGSGSPFDLNKVQVLPENIDEFIQKNSGNLEQNRAKSPLKIVTDFSPASSPLCELLSPHKSPATEASSTVEIEQDTEREQSPLLTKSPIEKSESPVLIKASPAEHMLSISPTETKSSIHEVSQTLICDFSKTPPESKSPIPRSESPESKSPIPRSESPESIKSSKSPVPDFCQFPSRSPVVETKSPLLDIESELDTSKSPFEVIPSKSPLMEEQFEQPKITDISQTLLCEFSSSSISKSPVSKSPVPKSPVSASPVFKSPISKSPVCELSRVSFSKSPVCDISKSPILDMNSPISSPVGPLSPKSPIPELTGLVSPDITASIKDENISGEISESKSPIMNQTPLDDCLKSPNHFLDNISKSPDVIVEATKSSENSQTEDQSETKLIEQTIESIDQISDIDMTAGNNIHEINKKDDIKVQQLISDAIQDITENIEDPVQAKSPELKKIVTEEITDIINEASNVTNEAVEIINEVIENVSNEMLDIGLKTELAPQENPCENINLTKDNENSIASMDSTKEKSTEIDSEVTSGTLNSFLERSELPEVTSPLSPTEEVEKFQTELPESFKERPLEIICETIQPEFPVHIITSPSEESKGTETPPPTTAIDIEKPELKCPSPEVEKIFEAVEKLDTTSSHSKEIESKDDILPEATAAAEVITVAAAVATVAVSAPAIAAVADKPTAKATIKSTTLTKKPLASKTTSATPTKPLPPKTPTTMAKKSLTPSKTTPGTLVTAKVSSPKLKAASTTSKSSTLTKTTPKTKTSATAPPAKVPEKKPLLNGDIKLATRGTLVKRTTPTTLSMKPTATAAKLSPTKPPATFRPSSATKPTVTTTKTTTTRPSTATSAPKPKMTNLPPRSIASSGSTTKPPLPKSSTAKGSRPSSTISRTTSTTTAPRPKTSTTSSTGKPIMSTTAKPATKAPYTEKQIKETANKQLSASKTTSSRTTSNSTKSTSTTTAKKMEIKSTTTSRPATGRTTPLKSTTKKPGEITKTTIIKTKTTSTKPITKQNGVVDVIQEITTTIVKEDPQLLKDNSPVDNVAIDNSKLPPMEIIAD